MLPVPCEHCAEPLQGRVRFCPYCGEDASLSFSGGAASEGFEPERETPGFAKTIAPAATDLAAGKSPVDEADSQVVLLGPAAFEWPEGLPARIDVPPPALTQPHGAFLTRFGLGKAAALVLASLALALLVTPRSNKQDETLALRDQARVAGQRAAGVLALGDAVAPAAQVPPVVAAPAAEAPSVAQVAEPPAIAAAAPAVSVAPPRRSDCSDALAALALCER